MKNNKIIQKLIEYDKKFTEIIFELKNNMFTKKDGMRIMKSLENIAQMVKRIHENFNNQL